MSSNSNVINVRVSRRILWVGSEAYPLQNIARAQTLKLVPQRGAPFRGYLKAVTGLVILDIAATIVLKVAASKITGFPDSRFKTLLQLVVLASVAISTIRLILALLKRTYYALIIETAGTPRAALVSTDENLVSSLVYQIMDAIDNPQAEFQVQVENFHVGDKIQQFGNHNVGKLAQNER
jgi:hypothetical protein